MSSVLTYSLSPSLSFSIQRGVYVKHQFEQEQDLTNEQISRINSERERYSLSSLGLLPSQQQLNMESELAFSIEALYRLEASLCGSEINFENIEHDIDGCTLLHHFVSRFNRPVGNYHESESDSENQYFKSIIKRKSAHTFGKYSIDYFSKKYEILIRNNIDIDAIEEIIIEKFGNVYQIRPSEYIECLINSFYSAIRGHISNFNFKKFSSCHIIYQEDLDLSRPTIDQAIAQISPCLKNRRLAGELYEFARELTVIDRIIFAMVIRGIDINEITIEAEETALHWAVQQRNCFLLVLALLKYSADPNLPNIDGNTPLHSTFNSEQALSLLPILLCYGADPNLPDANGETPLHLALNSKYAAVIISILLCHGADPSIRNRNNKSVLDMAQNKNDYESVRILKLALPPESMHLGAACTTQKTNKVSALGEKYTATEPEYFAAKDLQQILLKSSSSKQPQSKRSTRGFDHFLNSVFKTRVALNNIV